MSTPEWIERIRHTLEISEGLEIFVLIGPADGARPALEQVARATASHGFPRWHRLHVEGISDVLESHAERRAIRLVYGLERVEDKRAARLCAELNVNRDQLSSTRDAYVLYIAEELLETFLHNAVDLLAWRSMLSRVEAAEIEWDDDRELAERLLRQAWTQKPTFVPERTVRVGAGTTMDLLAWFDAGGRALNIPDTNEGRVEGNFAAIWLVRKLAERAEQTVGLALPLLGHAGDTWFRPRTAFEAATRHSNLPHRLHAALRRLWEHGELEHFFVDPPADWELPPRSFIASSVGDARLEPLSDAQARQMLSMLLSDGTSAEEDWSPYVDALIEATRGRVEWRSAWFIEAVLDPAWFGPQSLHEALLLAEDESAMRVFLVDVERELRMWFSSAEFFWPDPSGY
jgi:hypothetical protein